MGKKVEKGLNKEKNQSATSQDDTDSNKALGERKIINRQIKNIFSKKLSLFSYPLIGKAYIMGAQKNRRI